MDISGISILVESASIDHFVDVVVLRARARSFTDSMLVAAARALAAAAGLGQLLPEPRRKPEPPLEPPVLSVEVVEEDNLAILLREHRAVENHHPDRLGEHDAASRSPA